MFELPLSDALPTRSILLHPFAAWPTRASQWWLPAIVEVSPVLQTSNTRHPRSYFHSLSPTFTFLFISPSLISYYFRVILPSWTSYISTQKGCGQGARSHHALPEGRVCPVWELILWQSQPGHPDTRITTRLVTDCQRTVSSREQDQKKREARNVSGRYYCFLFLHLSIILSSSLALSKYSQKALSQHRAVQVCAERETYYLHCFTVFFFVWRRRQQLRRREKINMKHNHPIRSSRHHLL